MKRTVIKYILIAAIASSIATTVTHNVIQDYKWHTFNIDKQQYNIENYSYDKDTKTISIVLEETPKYKDELSGN